MGILELKDTLKAEAFILGRRDGKLGASSIMNPHSVGSFEYIEWERGRQSGADTRTTQPTNVKPCPYVRGVACNCGGIGLCLDVA